MLYYSILYYIYAILQYTIYFYAILYYTIFMLYYILPSLFAILPLPLLYFYFHAIINYTNYFSSLQHYSLYTILFLSCFTLLYSTLLYNFLTVVSEQTSLFCRNFLMNILLLNMNICQ